MKKTDNTVYIVTGNPRSGTSAMMGALIAAGMKGNYSKAKDERVRKADGDRHKVWPKNKKGFFEGPHVKMDEAIGMVTKRFKFTLRPNMKIIWMDRPKRQRNTSAGMADMVVFDYSDYEHLYPDATKVWFEELIFHTGKVYDRLVAAGWPLRNKQAFCDWIEPELYRCRN